MTSQQSPTGNVLDMGIKGDGSVTISDVVLSYQATV